MRRPFAVPGDRTGVATPDAASDQVGSKQLHQALVGTRPLEEITGGTFFGYLILGRSYQHIYEHVPPSDTAEVEKDFLPNRHAAVHGLVAYAEHKHSMLVMTDSIFRILPSAEIAAARAALRRRSPLSNS